MNPMTDASIRQVYYSNQMFPIEKNLRNILMHYDQFGFGNGFDLIQPTELGKHGEKIKLTKFEVS